MPIKMLVLSLLLLSMPVLSAQAPKTRVEGEQLRIVGEVTVVVTKLPFDVVAPTGYKVYSWEVPPTWKSDAKRFTLKSRITVTVAPEGSGVVSVLAVKSLEEEPVEFTLTVNVGKVGVVLPPPPKDGALYFMLVRPNGPVSRDFEKVARDPAWQTLTKAGHRYKDFTVDEARAKGATIPVGTPLPCVVTLRIVADGKASKEARGPIPLPTTSAGIIQLPVGVP